MGIVFIQLLLKFYHIHFYPLLAVDPNSIVLMFYYKWP